MKRKVYLEGELGEKFGKEFTMNVNSFAEAIRCLDCNFSGFKKYMVESEDRGIGFVCEVAGTPIQDERELLLIDKNEGDFTITAVPMGSKKGVKIIIGVILMAVAISMGDPGSAATWGQMFLFSLGANLTITGVQELLAPDPSVDDGQDESYLYQGTGQTIIEGDPVPLLYGKLRVPARPISIHLRNERLNYYDPGDILMEYNANNNGTNQIPGGGGFGGGNPGEDTRPGEDFGDQQEK